MTLRICPNRFVVVECIQNFPLSALGGPFLLTHGTVNGESDEYFSHWTLLKLVTLRGRYDVHPIMGF
jgi:hypothetical protein